MKSAFMSTRSVAGLTFQKRCQNRRGTMVGSGPVAATGGRVAAMSGSSRCHPGSSRFASSRFASTTRPLMRASPRRRMINPCISRRRAAVAAVVGLTPAARAKDRTDSKPRVSAASAARTNISSRECSLVRGVTPSLARSRSMSCSSMTRAGRPWPKLFGSVNLIPRRLMARETR